MLNLFKKIKKKVNGMIITCVISGIVLLLLAVLIVWSDFAFRIVMGFLTLVIAYVFFYCAYKIWSLKREVEKYFKL